MCKTSCYFSLKRPTFWFVLLQVTHQIQTCEEKSNGKKETTVSTFVPVTLCYYFRKAGAENHPFQGVTVERLL